MARKGAITSIEQNVETRRINSWVHLAPVIAEYPEEEWIFRGQNE